MDRFMQMALDEARASQREGGNPYGAVLVRQGEIIGVGHNRAIQNNDPISHGEIEAIRAAGLQDDYSDTILYTNAFPCVMCAGAIVRLGIPKVVIGATPPGYESSRTFLQANGIELIDLNSDECHQLLEQA